MAIRDCDRILIINKVKLRYKLICSRRINEEFKKRKYMYLKQDGKYRSTEILLVRGLFDKQVTF